ncbi:MAG TPA: 4Fe-4S binding protein [Candidatus Anoxymicrobiaceae bacterium]|jgi:heterodisulfide reductase subunit C
MMADDSVVLEINDFAKELAAASNIDLELSCCFGCARCSSVCKAAIFSGAADGITPRSFLYKAVVGGPAALLQSEFIWYCSGCRRCDEACPQDVKVSEAVTLIRRLAVDSGIVNPYAARVNERVCMHCGACASVCPNDAITIIEAGPHGLVARVDPAECRGCGACSSVCSNAAIQQGAFHDIEVLTLFARGARSGEGRR